MYRGHDPDAIREYAWRDIVLYLELEPVLDAHSSVGWVGE